MLRCQAALKPLLKSYFAGLSNPVAWCTSAGPVEILRALGFNCYFPENHGALLGATRTAGTYIPLAHQAGYANEVCSYLTSDIGAYLAGRTPLTEAYGLASVPRPDLIVYNTNQCREVADWFSFYGREFNCPVAGICPPRHLEEVSVADIDNVTTQFENLITVGEKVIGARLDGGHLAETVRLSKQASDLWKSLLECAMQAPSPLTFFDGTILMAPIVMLRGTPECVAFYRDAVDELRTLMAGGYAAVPGERVRIYWEGMPIWGRLRALSEVFAENRAAVVASTYCSSWVFDQFDEHDPLRSTARAYSEIFINRSENAKLLMLRRLLEQFHVDGAIFHDSKTCFNNTNCRFDLHRRLQRTAGVPVLTIDGDLNDLRFFSEGQSRTRIETFVEQVMSRK
jgi:benzoyl-CoA reductase/2-hydroxyglutaryl-CoA dehydratase subunit BcrC/BadD/HgdB